MVNIVSSVSFLLAADWRARRRLLRKSGTGETPQERKRSLARKSTAVSQVIYTSYFSL
ncbi:hypothetical protein [Priestia sp. SB1]|uniref:hypothetical protein n=1 Tax=Priestia sp. SB1 TaxID=3132359 RepID=UPI00319E4295